MTSFFSRGFSLIEVLVAVLVLSVGLLGLAGLQMSGVRQTNSAYQRSQATVLAYDMADRIRRNMMGYQNGHYNNIAASGTDPGCITTGCTDAQIAQYDEWQWNEHINTVLGDAAEGVVTTTSDGRLEITVRWNDDRSAGLDEFKMDFLP